MENPGCHILQHYVDIGRQGVERERERESEQNGEGEALS
jgi:hypothetical protein